MVICRKAYHHGDLREALVEEAETMLEAEGAAGLSLRKLGRKLGVTPGAPYRHFEDKDALLAALAAEGYRKLLTEMVRDRETATHGEQRLKLAGAGYIRFAAGHPELFRLMFGWIPSGEVPELQEAAEATHEELIDILRECEEEGVLRSSVEDAGLFAWSVVHGAAFLLIGDHLELKVPDSDPKLIIDHLHDTIWSGIGRHS